MYNAQDKEKREKNHEETTNTTTIATANGERLNAHLCDFYSRMFFSLIRSIFAVIFFCRARVHCLDRICEYRHETKGPIKMLQEQLGMLCVRLFFLVFLSLAEEKSRHAEFCFENKRWNGGDDDDARAFCIGFGVFIASLRTARTKTKFKIPNIQCVYCTHAHTHTRPSNTNACTSCRQRAKRIHWHRRKVIFLFSFHLFSAPAQVSTNKHRERTIALSAHMREFNGINKYGRYKNKLTHAHTQAHYRTNIW